ncbi:MAG TPA: pitrilysin family protein [Anaerolineales bacterium]|nr:pitrilysin family protein [Anaerolineales bacterium]
MPKTKTKTKRKPAGTPTPPALDTSSFPGPDNITRVILPNGIIVLARENFTSPAVVFEGSLYVGGLDEPREKAGLARFTAACLMRGNEKRSFGEIYEQIESIGARLSVSGGTHTSGFGGKSLAEDLDLMLGLAADALRRPTFPPDHVEKLRGEIMTGLAIRAHDTGAMASLAFDELLYPDHPYGASDDGYPETIAAITRDDLNNFHKTHFSPKGMIVTIVGAVKTAEAVSLVEKHFGDWSASQPERPPLPPAPRIPDVRRKYIPIPGKSQCDIVIGCVGPKRSDSDFLDTRLANNIFGVFGMYGRLGDVVREKHGLAYYALSQITGGLGPGPWQIVAGVNPKNVELATELIVKEMKRLITTKVTAAELADNKSYFIGRLPLQLETNEGVAGTIESMELYDLGLDYLRRYPSLINEITRDRVQAAAAKYLDPERYAVAVAGPE